MYSGNPPAGGGNPRTEYNLFSSEDYKAAQAHQLRIGSNFILGHGACHELGFPCLSDLIVNGDVPCALRRLLI